MTSISPNLDQIRAILREFGYVMVPAQDIALAIGRLGGGKPEREAKSRLSAALNASADSDIPIAIGKIDSTTGKGHVVGRF